MAPEVLRQTWSVCPVCLKRIPAQRVRVGDEVRLRKACPEHGSFDTVVWRGRVDYAAWLGDAEGAPMAAEPRCPEGCGLCPDHLRGTCCVLLEVTRRCDLGCRFCFAQGAADAADPPFAQVRQWLEQLAEPGRTLVQLSGGEPTLRDDLPELVAAARAAGCRYVQLNSNGLRLAEDPGYLRALAEAGLSFVFMQFDGVTDAVYRTLRGRPLLAAKTRAIERCAELGLGVTLVPTLVPGLNTDQVGAILEFARRRSPAVRGVHFQPVSFFGRVPAAPDDAQRCTLDELMAEIEAQTGGAVPASSLLPSCCDHPLCGFHGDFVVAPDGRLVPLSRRRPVAQAPRVLRTSSPAERNRAFVARRWQRPKDPPGDGRGDLHSLDGFLDRVRSHGFTITAMAFQDAGNLDLERLRRCSLHVFDQGRMVPFCARYLTGWPA